MAIENKNTSSWLDRPLSSYLPKWNLETLLVIVILLMTVGSRFYDVGLRVMSHDEVNHVVPSWDLYQGRGYRHDPVTHGPLQFHLVALSYFILGDSDFSARLPALLFSIATVAVVLFGFRRYLGRSGALIAGLLFMISPYILFYGRYTRNEAFVALLGVLILYATLRYLDRGDHFSMYLLTAATALNFTAKETAYIYAAQLLMFLGFIFLRDVLTARWSDPSWRRYFTFLGVWVVVLLVMALAMGAWSANLAEVIPEAAADVEEVVAVSEPMKPQELGAIGSLAGAVLIGSLAIFLLVRDQGWQSIRSHRSFHLLILVGTLVLPLLSAFPVRIVGWDPLDYSTTGMLHTAIFLVLFTIIAVAIGLWWQPRLWLSNAALFFGIFTVLYTTFFTNGQGFFTGIVGSLGYWLSQQGVERGSQPWYYYAAVQVPLYEYLAALGTLVALYFGVIYNRFFTFPGHSPAQQPEELDNIENQEIEEPAAPRAHIENDDVQVQTPLEKRLPILFLLIFWSLTSLAAYSIAGEKMPWLTVHIALPLLLTAGWGFGYLVDTTPWKKVVGHQGLLAIVILPVFIGALGGLLGSLLGNQMPFQGNTLEQLQASSTFLLSVVVLLLSGWGILRLLVGWEPLEIGRLSGVVFFAFMGLLTVRTAYNASFVNYDNAKEYLVYAHAARGPKDVLEQVEEISQRITRGKDIVVAYDNDGLYPYWWYFRDYPNHRWYTDKPTRDLRDAPLIIASETNYGKLDSIVKDNYVYYEYMRLWWPNQDYFNLTWERIWNAIKDREMRSAVFKIWLNRDYSDYAQLTNSSSLTLETWQPSSRMRFYVRNDVVSQIWEYGAAPAIAQVVDVDAYQDKLVELTADTVFGASGDQPGQLQAPRGIAVAQDETIYVADSQNHRIQRFSPDGELLNNWGSFSGAAPEAAQDGAFNEPWGVAVGPDGSVYVADTWNHRIQKFSPEGEFLLTWGHFGQAESPEAMWGPRDVAVDAENRVYVTDTGNKRILVFSSNGQYVTQFGSVGMGLGELDEPVGIALDEQGVVYIVDTWNQRVQVFVPDESGTAFTPMTTWEVNGWFGQSLDNKPFIATDSQGHVFVTDPEGYRVLEFSGEGSFVRGWGDYSPGIDGFGLPSGIATDSFGYVWVSDAGNNRLLRYPMP